ncbi:MAG: hypothetical protein ACRC1H_12585 [Caldilineaceae bacterium]
MTTTQSIRVVVTPKYVHGASSPIEVTIPGEGDEEHVLLVARTLLAALGYGARTIERMSLAPEPTTHDGLSQLELLLEVSHPASDGIE